MSDKEEHRYRVIREAMERLKTEPQNGFLLNPELVEKYGADVVVAAIEEPLHRATESMEDAARRGAFVVVTNIGDPE